MVQTGLLARMSPFRVRRAGVDWVVDSLLFAIALFVWLVYLGYAADGGVPREFVRADALLGLVGCVALWWSRSHPVAVAVLMIVPGSLALTATAAVMIVVFRLAVYARPTMILVITALHIAAALPYHAFLPVEGMTWTTWLIVVPLMYLAAISLGLLERIRRIQVERLVSDADAARERYESQLRVARRSERERIAREMHDVLAHRISLVSVHAGALEYRTTTQGEPPTVAEIHEAAHVIRENAHLAVEELRQVLDVLRDDETEVEGVADSDRRPQPRVDDLQRLFAEAESAGQRIEPEVDAAATTLPLPAQRTVYRVVQEGLTNARKHAPSSVVEVEVSAEPDAVNVRIANSTPVGVTAREIPGAGAGLTGLAERVRIEGGTLRHGLTDGRFELVATLPRRAT
jgi:signal transduction histidine kinase